MLRDFTPHVRIERQCLRLYRMLRVLLWVAFAVFITYAFVKVVFPNHYGYFDFTQYYGSENTIYNPRLESGEITRGPVDAQGGMIFNVIARGEFERVQWSVRPENTEKVAGGTLSMIRTYRAMLYEMGDPVELRDGSLVSFDSRYFLVSDGKLREIIPGDLEGLGFTAEQFTVIHEEEYLLHEEGKPVGGDEYWTEKGLFTDGEGLYLQVREGRLDEFSSERSYLSQYRKEDARIMNRVLPDQDIVKTIGFSDGMLIGYGDGVFATEGEFIRPIDSPESFLSKGYEWDMVVPVTKEEFSAYERGDIYTLQRPHVNGAVFRDDETGQMFLVEEGVRREIVGDHIQRQYEAVPAVTADADPEVVTCRVERKVIGGYGCKMEVEGVGSSSEYQFQYQPTDDLILEEMKIMLVRGKDMESFRVFMAEVRSRIGDRFGI